MTTPDTAAVVIEARDRPLAHRADPAGGSSGFKTLVPAGSTPAERLVGATLHRLKPGVALFIPGAAWHGMPIADQSLRRFHTFAALRFA